MNCDYAHPEFLDESRVEILFLGENFKGFIDVPLHLDRIKYLYVHKDNPYFVPPMIFDELNFIFITEGIYERK